MTTKIDKRIVKYSVAKAEGEAPAPKPEATPEVATPVPALGSVVHMHESVKRPTMLFGSTYKIKPGDSEHALYLTINDIVLNPGTEHELRRPFEIFINSKNMEHFQWIVALTRVMSAVFRKGGDVTFLVEELRSVFDPGGGYWKKGKRVPSMVAEIGDVLDCHLRMIGMLKGEGLSECQQKFLADKRADYERTLAAAEQGAPDAFPTGASLCPKCQTRAMIKMDNCLTCLNCGESKCG
jgi:hypothetical protein